MKKQISIICIALFSVMLTFAQANLTFNNQNAVKDNGNVTFNSIGAEKLVYQMKTGWNLGNTMDSIGNNTLAAETSWQQPLTTKEMIDGLAASGMKTIRIPTSWANHIIDDKYTIDPAWMARVKTIVDWCIEDDLYVVLNSHHDNFATNTKMPYGKGYYPTKENYDESEIFLSNLWAQISLAFNNGYDEHLIFETLNEPRLCGTPFEWYYNRGAPLSKEGAETLNKFNQIILNQIRMSGGNNAKRYVMIPGLAASPDSALAAEFKMPDDVAPNQLLVSVHMYSPYNFAMASPGDVSFTIAHKAELEQTFKRLNEKFVKNGYPVVVGEYGATNKNNLADRVAWFEFFNKTARANGMVCLVWDNGAYRSTKKGDYNEKYGYYNRRAQTWYFPDILDAIMKGCE